MKSLDGVRVIEVAAPWSAGSLLGQLLAELGADVVRVRPLAQSSRTAPDDLLEPDDCGHLTGAPGPDRLRDLVTDADVVIDDADSLVSFGVDPSLVTKAAPHVVMCRTALTRDDVSSNSDLLAQARSGLTASTGHPDAVPAAVHVSVAAHAAAAVAVVGVLAALYERRSSGLGQEVEVSADDVLFAFHSNHLGQLIADGDQPDRLGFKHSLLVPWDAYRALDGPVVLCASNDNQWRALVELMGRSDLLTDQRFATQLARKQLEPAIDQIVQTWVSTMTVAEALEKLDGAGLPCAPILDVRQVIDHPQFRSRAWLVPDEEGRSRRGSWSVFGFDRDEDATRRSHRVLVSPARIASEAPKTALDGIRVVEITSYTAGPLCGEYLAQLGAEVIYVERPFGDHMRDLRYKIGGASYTFHVNNAGKRCVTADIREEGGRQRVLDLIRGCDVVIENAVPGVMERRGLGFDDVRRINDRAIYASITGFGRFGPYGSKPAYDVTIQALSGLAGSTFASAADPRPVKIGPSIVDVSAGVMGAATILAALHDRERTGRGRWVEVPMYDVAVWMTQSLWSAACESAGSEDFRRLIQSTAEQIVECRNGLVAVAAGTSDIPALADLVGDDARMTPSLASPLLVEWARDCDVDEVAHALQAVGVSATRVRSLHEIVEDPTTVARGLMVSVNDHHGRPHLLPGSPFRLSRTPGVVSALAENLGQSDHRYGTAHR